MTKLVSWNVNGLRACLGKGFYDFIGAADADMVCLQETKMQEGQAEVHTPGYFQYWHSAEKKGYSGTLLLTRERPLSVRFGMGIDEHDKEGRVITAEYPDYFLVNVYTPNSQDELRRLDYRMAWDEVFRFHLLSLDQKKPVIVCGDMNVAHKEIDLKNPKTNRKSAGFTDEERAKMSELLESGFIDTFRHFYPDLENAYTWWSFRSNARANNTGWRIDYFLVSQALAPRLADAAILPEVQGSDHCPVVLELKD